jgi:chaperonin cofactor prefoldin
MMDLSRQTVAARQLEQREQLMHNRIAKLKRDNEKAQQQIKVSEHKFARLEVIHEHKSRWQS